MTGRGQTEMTDMAFQRHECVCVCVCVCVCGGSSLCRGPHKTLYSNIHCWTHLLRSCYTVLKIRSSLNLKNEANHFQEFLLPSLCVCVCVCVCVCLVFITLWGPNGPTRIVIPVILDNVGTFFRSPWENKLINHTEWSFLKI